MTPLQQFVSAYLHFTESDLTWISGAYGFDPDTPETYIESWISTTEERLVVEAMRCGRSVISKPETGRTTGRTTGPHGEKHVIVRAVTAPMIDLS